MAALATASSKYCPSTTSSSNSNRQPALSQRDTTCPLSPTKRTELSANIRVALQVMGWPAKSQAIIAICGIVVMEKYGHQQTRVSGYPTLGGYPLRPSGPHYCPVDSL